MRKALRKGRFFQILALKSQERYISHKIASLILTSPLCGIRISVKLFSKRGTYLMALLLTYVDELITARKNLHGGNVGAPRKLVDGGHEGSALNRACVVMLTSALQAYVGEVFVTCSEKAFGRSLSDDDLKLYSKTWDRWGNPSAKNITQLFQRLGVKDVFEGLSWQKQNTQTLRKNLDTINQVRNKIAHGQVITVDGKPYSLQIATISRWRKVLEQFGTRFEEHALGKIR